MLFTQCNICAAGQGPNANNSKCEACRGNKYSIQGQCLDCPAGQLANAMKVGCEEVGDAPLEDLSTALEVLSATNYEPKASLEMAVDDSAVLTAGPVQDEYISQLLADLARSLNVSSDTIQITNFGSVRGGSIDTGRRRAQSPDGQVSFDLLLTGPSAGESLSELTTQLDDPASALRTSAIGGSIDPDVAPVFAFACPVGLYRPLDGDPAGGSLCVSCPDAAMQIPDSLADFRSCRECLPGQAPDAETGSHCVCAGGFYNSTESVIHCYADGEDWTEISANAGAADCVACSETGCLQGYDPDNEIFGQITCNLGSVEIHPGSSVSMLSALEDKPFNEIRNQRGIFPCDADTCTVDSDGKPACEAGYTGPLCAYCDVGYSRPGFEGKCNECSQSMSYVWAVFGGLLSLTLIVSVLYFVASVDATAGKMSVIITLGKIAVSLIQVLTNLQFTLDLTWPDVFLAFVNMLKLFSFDLLGFIDVGCVTTYTYYTKVAFAATLPPILLGSVVVVYYLRKNVDGIFNRCVKMALTVIFLIYPFISQTVFQGFSCRQLDSGEDWLDVDFQVDCNSTKYLLQFWSFGLIGVWVYPIGIPLATMLLLFKNGKSIKKQGKAFERYEFLVADYTKGTCDKTEMEITCTHTLCDCCGLPMLPAACVLICSRADLQTFTTGTRSR